MGDISEDLLVVVGQRRRGRPRVEEPRSTLSTWVWAKHHDRLIQIANAQQKSVSALVRDILTKAVPVE